MPLSPSRNPSPSFSPSQDPNSSETSRRLPWSRRLSATISREDSSAIGTPEENVPLSPGQLSSSRLHRHRSSSDEDDRYSGSSTSALPPSLSPTSPSFSRDPFVLGMASVPPESTVNVSSAQSIRENDYLGPDSPVIAFSDSDEENGNQDLIHHPSASSYSSSPHVRSSSRYSQPSEQDQDADDPFDSTANLTSGSINLDSSALPTTHDTSPRSKAKSGVGGLGGRKSLETGGGLRASVARGLRRVSLRVVNVHAKGFRERDRGGVVKLDDEDPLEMDTLDGRQGSFGGGMESRLNGSDEAEFKLSSGGGGAAGGEIWRGEEGGRRNVLLGKSLGLFGPESPLRRACWRVLRLTWTEPIILFLILTDAVVITIQGAKDKGGEIREDGWFRVWEDYVRFVIFIVFTIEMFARIIVSGLMIDPQTTADLLAFQQAQPSHHSIHSNNPFSDAASQTPSTRRALASAPYATFRRARTKLRAVLLLSGSRDADKKEDLEVERKLAVKRRKEEEEADELVSSDEDEMMSFAPEEGFGQNGFRNRRTITTPNRSRHPSSDPRRAPQSRQASTSTTSTKPSRELPFQRSLAAQRKIHSLNRPYLRHSWHRVDFLVIIAFWIMFFLAVIGEEIRPDRHLFIFRAISVLRACRLLLMTSGTATILHSLKRAGPLLLNVAFYILFASILFSIVGVQSFRGSLRRSCYLLDNAGGEPVSLSHLCGGWYNSLTDTEQGYVPLDALVDLTSAVQFQAPKGYICPRGQVCVESDNVNAGVSFDNIASSMLQVVVIAGLNGWGDLMYNMMDAENNIVSLYFVGCVVILNFWFSSLLIAVITNVFGDVRAETKRSAFGASAADATLVDDDWSQNAAEASVSSKKKASSWLAKAYDKTKVIWPLIALLTLAASATATASSSNAHLQLLDNFDIASALAFDVEIIIRVVMVAPDFKAFAVDRRNWFDLVLAVGASVIQLPGINRTEVANWLSIFPLARWYRVILLVPRMRPLLFAVFGSIGGLLNMIAFLVLMNLLAALFALQLFQGDIQPDDDKTMIWSQIWNAFLAQYQIFSSEDWTDPLYTAMSSEFPFAQGVIAAIFLSTWFLFANFVLMQMFIAVIGENFAVAEEEKRKQQVVDFIQKSQPRSAEPTWVEKLNPYKYLRAKPNAIQVKNLPPELVLPLERSIVRDLSAPETDRSKGPTDFERTGDEGFFSYIRRRLKMDSQTDQQRALADLDRLKAFKSQILPSNPHFDITLNNGPSEIGRGIDVVNERRNAQADFIAAHPGYDVSLFIFSQSNRLRRFCQTLVPPATGERIFGQPAIPGRAFTFKLILYSTVITSITIAAIATPAYRRDFYVRAGGMYRGSWFDTIEGVLALVFVLEFFVKSIADGFLFAPNAYLYSTWNIIDFFVLGGLLINTITSLIYIGGLSRFTRSLKALRALRLITLSARLKETFHSVLFAGADMILDAAVLVILYLIPFSVWGLNIFRGRLYRCNNGDASGLAECVQEWIHTPIDNVGGGFPVPAVWANPTLDESIWSFDSFRSSILILFESVSLEGWIDVTSSTMAITGDDLQPENLTTQWNAIFMLTFNLFGAVIMMALFVSIIIENFAKRAGTSLLTTEQRQWVDMQKTIYRQQPSKRPKRRPSSGLRLWCFHRAVQKHGWWSRSMTAVYIFHIIVLMTQSYANTAPNSVGEISRNWLYVLFVAIFYLDLAIRAYGLGWKSFRTNGWNAFDIVSSTGALATTLAVISLAAVERSAIIQLQKLFLVSIAFKLVQKNSKLNQLFKISVASLGAIGNVFLLWLALFFVFAICKIEVFSLAKWQNSETRNINFRDFWATMLLLALQTTGEAWNGYMHDFAVEWPRCTESDDYLQSDCGSSAGAYFLFIVWNIVSMYLFVNVLLGVVVESFSYVFQLPGKTSLTREEIRLFKKSWAEFDNERKGYLRRDQFAGFFARLSGLFEVRPYPKEASIPSLLAVSAPTSGQVRASHIIDGAKCSIDLHQLNAALDRIDFAAVKKRKDLYNRLCQEASIQEELSFTSMMLLLSHYKLINDDDALLLPDLLARRAKTDFVQDLVRLDKIKRFLQTVRCRQRFLADRRARIEAQIPSIVLLTTPPHHHPSLSVDITSPSSRRSRQHSASNSSSASTAPNSPPHHQHNPDLLDPFSSTSTPSSSRGENASGRLSVDISSPRMARAESFDRPPTSPEPALQGGEDLLASMQSKWGGMVGDSDSD